MANIKLKHNKLQEMGLCIPPLPILSCEAALSLI